MNSVMRVTPYDTSSVWMRKVIEARREQIVFRLKRENTGAAHERLPGMIRLGVVQLKDPPIFS